MPKHSEPHAQVMTQLDAELHAEARTCADMMGMPQLAMYGRFAVMFHNAASERQFGPKTTQLLTPDGPMPLPSLVVDDKPLHDPRQVGFVSHRSDKERANEYALKSQITLRERVRRSFRLTNYVVLNSGQQVVAERSFSFQRQDTRFRFYNGHFHEA
jgi:hypothetical protein